MNRRAGAVVVGVVVVGIALIAAWWLRRGGEPAQHAAADHRSGARAIGSGPAVDPRAQPRASISGTITDGAAPVAGASVCANLVVSAAPLPAAIAQRPACTISDRQGQYKIVNLVAAEYALVAAAPQFQPGAFHPGPGPSMVTFALAAGEVRTGVDVALIRGGVEVTGLVRDISGGPIAHAQVRASSRALRQSGAVVETDDQGRFSLWADRGGVLVEARADGYASNHEYGSAPGTFQIALTPESSMAGRVVDAATDQPVPGARVELESTASESPGRQADLTDAQGAFRIERLAPGRFTAVATAEHGYGRSDGSTLVGLGQHVDGVVIKLFPARRIEGRIVVAAAQRPCSEGAFSLNDMARGRWLGVRSQRDGSVVVNGILPGTYRATISCEGYIRRNEESIEVRDADITGVVWQVEEGARIRGKVVTRAGGSVADAQLTAQNVGGAARDSVDRAAARSQQDGRYELLGLKPGAYRITVTSHRGVSPRDGYTVTVAAGATVEQDLVLEDGGKVTGTVVDEDDRPVSATGVEAVTADRSWLVGDSGVTTDGNGAFTIEALRPGDYEVRAQAGREPILRTPGTPGPFDGQSVTVRAGETATVKLRVESRTGAITGTVVDAAGAPVPDAFVSSARDLDPEIRGTSSVARTRMPSWGQGWSVLTSPAGRFTLDKLARGKYAVRSFRKGGGEAFAEHVAVGATVKLQIKPTGSIAGTVRSNGSPLQELKVAIHDEQTGFGRTESFYRTGGRFKLDDLPAGHFEIAASSDGGQKVTTVDLAEGETRTGIELSLEILVTVTGRLVDQTQKPIAGFRVFVNSTDAGSSSISTNPDMGPESVTDESGRFKVSRIRLGQVMIAGIPAGGSTHEVDYVHTVRMVAGSGTVDLGEIRVVRPRVKHGEPRGKLGIRFVQQPEGTTPDKTELEIETIDPEGPAAKTALRVGDVITSFDGIDVTGAGSADFWMLMQAAPGTKVTLGTQRGVTVTAVLAAP